MTLEALVTQVTSYPDGKLVVEVLRDKFDGDSICVQCRERDNSWDRSGWVRMILIAINLDSEKQTFLLSPAPSRENVTRSQRTSPEPKPGSRP